MKSYFKKAIRIALGFTFSAFYTYASVGAMTLVLDPGHGGSNPGCVYNYAGNQVIEKDLNLKIAEYLKKHLEKYKTQSGENIDVFLTRGADECPSIAQRVKFAANKNAEALISIHNNAHPNKSIKQGGSMVLATASQYGGVYEKEEKLSKSILNELKKIGLNPVPNSKGSLSQGKSEIKEGIFRKLSDDGTIYPNGDTTDWYGIIRNGSQNCITSILVEHAYLSVEDDYNRFLSSDEKLEKLAIADALGIVSCYDLCLKENS